RRGKFILFALDDGRWLLAHLRMTGGFCVFPTTTPPHAYVRVIFHLADGRDLWYVDIRKFGRLYLVDSPEEVLHTLGVEPLGAEFTVERLADILRRRRGHIKPLLLNQSLIAGVGNIYADEALFRAGIHPLRRACELSAEEIQRLHTAVQQVLQEAIDHRGTTLRNYRDANGEEGENQFRLDVYRRQGEPCRRCGTPIERIVVGQRGTHFCPRCQPAKP
ncbi:MAG: bifunctional DNA-formamidopyrimidine glycosylase/DNA-(apurinic or apyrimidinic site) lyase, partial [Anaerolineae bacterium]